MKLKNGVEILSLQKKLGRVRTRARFSSAAIRASEELITRLRAAGTASLLFDFAKNQTKNDNFTYTRVSDVLPQDQDYIFVDFRALSKTFIEDYCIDLSQGDVLKESTPLLLGQTVYPNHDCFDVNNWLGSVSNAVWDETGDQSGGVPGIKAEYKIDALMNPRIARGLLMDPPAIHSTSMTFLFDFEFSHPDLVEEGKFWMLLGEAVEGSIVRLIVTKINEYWEASLVFQGADRLAKQIDDDEDDTNGNDFADMSAPPADPPPANSNQEKTMKLTTEQKAELGIEFDGEDVPETEIHKAALTLAGQVKAFGDVKPETIAELTARAEAGDKYTDRQRAEVTRLAKLAELGAEAGDLPKVVGDQIAAANFDTLVELETYYQAKVAEKFPQLARSSQEDPKAIENAGGVASTQKTTGPKVGVV